MNKVDFSNYKFRCSGLKHLMTEPKTKAEREAGGLSQTTKTYLMDIYIKEVFGRERPEVISGATTKGTIVESDSLDLVKQVCGENYFKNKQHYENDWIKGTPDVVTKGDLVVDIKSNFDLWTFSKADADVYRWQILGYMILTGKKHGRIDFCLVNTPEEVMFDEVRKLSWRMPEDEAEELVRKNHTFDDIPAELRLKQYHFDYDENLASMVAGKVVAAREYLKNLSLWKM